MTTSGQYLPSSLPGYFAWALETLPETRHLVAQLGKQGADYSSQIRHLLWRATYRPRIQWPAGFVGLGDWSRDTLSRSDWDYFSLIQEAPEDVIARPILHLGADQGTTSVPSPILEMASYDGFRRFIIRSLAGDGSAVIPMAALMIRGNPNQRLTIARFLGDATNGLVGLAAPAIPDLDQMLEWSRRIVEARELVLPDRLVSLAVAYANEVTRGGDD